MKLVHFVRPKKTEKVHKLFSEVQFCSVIQDDRKFIQTIPLAGKER